MSTDLIAFLDEWYRAQCDGDWEHEFSVTISNASNPGWILTVDLGGTDLEGRRLEDWSPVDEADDWLYCHSDGRTFEALSSVPGLGRVIDAFRRFVEGEIGETLATSEPQHGKPAENHSIRFVTRGQSQ